MESSEIEVLSRNRSVHQSDFEVHLSDLDLEIKVCSASENAFKGILTSLPEAGGGEFGNFYSLPALNDPRIGNFLTIFLSNEVVNIEHESILSQAQQHIALQKMVLRAGGVNLPGVRTGPTIAAETPTKVLCLTELITADELMDDGEYEEILEDIREEGEKFGECFIP
ncbi:hypothetical protein CsSME_00017782 [Camellia sinensis var. sinensis]